MNLQQLYYFKAVAELEHYTKAANELIVSQSSLSHAISDLEKELGAALFKPEGRNVRLTKYGALFLDYVSRSLEILDEGRARLSDLINPEAGTVAIAYLSSLNAMIPYVISRYFAATGKISTSFQFYQEPTKAIYEKILSGDADIALATDFYRSGQVNTHPIGVHETVVIVSKRHPLSAKEAVSLEELRGERIICYDHQCQIRDYLDAAFKEAGFRPNIVFETTHDSIIEGSVAADFGIGLIPKPLGQIPYNIKTLRILDRLPPREIVLIWQKSRYLSPVVRSFCHFLIECDAVMRDYLCATETETS